MSDQNTGTFQTSDRQVQTCIPSAIEMSVREVDWKRVYRKIKTIPKRTSIYQIISSVSWGIAASSFLALIPLYQATTGTEPWVKPTFWVIVIASLIIGFISQKYEKDRGTFIAATSEEIQKDMQEIYHTFFPNQDLDEE